MEHTLTWTRLPAALLLLVPLGCVPFQMMALPGEPVAAGGSQVKTGGASLLLGEVQQPAASPDKFIRKMDELVTLHRYQSARHLARRYPDVALEVLRNATASQARLVAVQAIAQIHDEQCSQKGEQRPWLALLQDRVAHPDRYADFDETRRQLLSKTQDARARESAQARLVKLAPCPLLEIEARRLLGETLLLEEKPVEAIKPLSTALESARVLQPYQAGQLALLLGEAQRRAGNTDQAGSTWQQAVLLTGQMLAGPRPVHDPILWERIASLRPVSSSWPSALGPILSSSDIRPVSLQTAAPSSVDEASIWTRVGQWRLERGEDHAALLAFKRAESLSADKDAQEQQQLLEAQALFQLDQAPSAMALLARVAEGPVSPRTSQALALIGAMKLKDGGGDQALVLLKRALTEGPESDWPGRAEAEADLGLACLMTGDEAGGLRYLHRAQAQFAAARHQELLVQCLENEVRYLEHKGKKERATEVRKQITACEGG
jgi:tetratricopeptide (TPR) repeat protein